MSNNIITCPNCSHQNHASEQFCANCGLWLQDFETRKTFSGMQGTQIKAKVQEIAQLRESNKLQIPELQASEIALAIDDAPNVLVIHFDQPVLLGRDAGSRSDSHPLIDFNDYRGYVMGVSRKHAMISKQSGEYYLVDLGSSNGTFLNGNRLNSNEPALLESGDRITLGQIDIVFFSAK
jgi:pSer/pThr/pTyr-binding forkhead associated (FHA) protein